MSTPNPGHSKQASSNGGFACGAANRMLLIKSRVPDTHMIATAMHRADALRFLPGQDVIVPALIVSKESLAIHIFISI